MNAIQLLVGVIALAREILALMRAQSDDKKVVKNKVHDMRKAVKKAREEGKTDDVEKMFRNLKFSVRD